MIISALLLGAHFLRAGQTILALMILLFPAVLLLKRAWVARLAQIVLTLGAIEWVRTLLFRVAERRDMEQPWVRLAVILGGVAVFTLASALLFSLSQPLRKRYRLE